MTKVRITVSERYPNYNYELVTDEDIKGDQELIKLGLLESVQEYKEIDSEIVDRWFKVIADYNNLQIELRELIKED